MTSRFAWLDTDDAQRRRMMEVVELFRDESTLDEIGIGSIRDTIANALFPGTSTLHTRLRYALFVPWLVQRASASAASSTRAVQGLRSSEVRLIESLVTGTAGTSDADARGVIGARARARLKNMPSLIYWGALGAWGIRTWDEGIEGHLRRSIGLRALHRSRPAADDPESRDAFDVTGFAAGMPDPPEDLLTTADFRLTAEEGEYVADRIRLTASGSLLAWLVEHPPHASVGAVWEVPDVHRAPTAMVELVDHGRRVSALMHGATLLYNLLLAEEATRTELAEQYRADLADWTAELHDTGVLDEWDMREFWSTLARHNPGITGRTRRFVDEWRDLAGQATDVATSAGCRDLVRLRERQIKGARARLGNQAALDRWSGASGLGRLGYRWDVAQRMLGDLRPALEAADARA